MRDGGVVLIVSIDTEEDNWNRARQGVTLENIGELRPLAGCFKRWGVRPTYFTTYQVVREPRGRAADVLREICDGGANGEIAAHLHPWNTPPESEAFVPRNSMLKNLPASLQRAKLRRLTSAIAEAFDDAAPPTAFRAGRYGLGSDTVAALVDCGYQVDSSITPHLSWEGFDDGPSFCGAPNDAYWLSPAGDVTRPAPGEPGRLFEIPLSCGFSRVPHAVWDPSVRAIDAAPWRRLRLAGHSALNRLYDRVTLNPELATASQMLALSRRLLERGVRHLQLTWHSPSLKPGLSPFTSSVADVRRFLASIEQYLDGLRRMTSVTAATVSEAAALLRQPLHSRGAPVTAPAEA